MEANRCDQCIEELRAKGYDVQWHEDNPEEFEKALEEIFGAPAEVKVKTSNEHPLTVWFGSMPESNGKKNWTAILHRGDIVEGFTIARSEYHDRVRYDADCVKYLVGEIETEPSILDYDGELQVATLPQATAVPKIPAIDVSTLAIKPGEVVVVRHTEPLNESQRAQFTESIMTAAADLPKKPAIVFLPPRTALGQFDEATMKSHGWVREEVLEAQAETVPNEIH